MPTKLNIFTKISFVFILFLFGLQSCKKEQIQLKTIRSETLKISESISSDSTFIQVIEPYKNKLDKEVNEVLAYNLKNLDRNDGKWQSSLGNLFADMCLEEANPRFENLTQKKIDFALFNYGGIRQSIPQGEVKVIDIFRLMPFENMLVVAELKGEKAKALFEYFVESERAHPLSGVNLTFEGDSLRKIEINGKVLDIQKNYFVLTSDYLQKGGDHMDFFAEPVNLFNLDYKLRDAMIDFIKKQDTIQANLDDRIIQQ